MMQTYWEQRIKLMYYKYIDEMLSVLTLDAKSIIDVGSGGTPILERLAWVPKKHSLDVKVPYNSNTVLGIKKDFFEFTPEEKYDFATCFQCIEHVTNPEKFVSKLFDIADKVLISVPHEWKQGAIEGHINDPVSYENVVEWARLKPTYFIIVDEPFNLMSKRAIYYWHKKGERFDFINAHRRFIGMELKVYDSDDGEN
ncbi:MAG: hypothetical protein FWB91_08600 [Defluviitaleaceae bacterium]|nr:hypothetical protein [Defluviitaleaceae bacterium]